MRRNKKRGGPPTLQGERNYQTARGILSPSKLFENDEEVQLRVVRNALNKRFGGNVKEIAAITSLAGSVEMFRKLGRLVIDRKTAADLIKRKVREGNRVVSKAGSRQDAAARFMTQTPYRPISDTRPSALKRKGPTRAEPQHGSFRGMLRTKVIGAVKTDKRMNLFIKSLDDLIHTIRSLGVKGTAKLPKISVKKYIK